MNSNTSSIPSEYLLLFRSTNWHEGLSPEETQNVMNQWRAWFDRLSKEGKVKGGQPLLNEGKVVSGKRGRTVADGPYAESKEAIAGYFLLQVASLDEAVRIAKDCPALDFGATVEVRPVALECPASANARQKLEGELAHAAN